jgi:hypothetical protein
MQFTLNREHDPEGSLLRPLLDAHLKYERTNSAKSMYLHLLAVVGLFLWVAAMWPDFIPGQIEELVLTLWGVLFVLLARASFETWTWHRKLMRYLRQHQAKQTGR